MDAKLLLRVRVLQYAHRGRVDIDADTLRLVASFGLCSLRNPVTQDFVLSAPLSKSLAPLVGNLHSRLEQDQAILRLDQVHAATEFLSRECLRIQFRIGGAQRKPEATFSMWRAVARTSTATS